MSDAPQKILIVGPALTAGKGAYGGGTGGYTRNLAVYLATLETDTFKLTPFFHSVRGQGGFLSRSLVVRMLRDSVLFLLTCLRHRPSAVHVLAQYRGALPREFVQALICQLLGIAFVYDIKAGAFEHSYRTGNRIYRWMMQTIVRRAALLFAEGKQTVRILRSDFGRDAVHFPNFVATSEIPKDPVTLFSTDTVRLLFVGYCYPDKGAVELVQGACQAAKRGQKLQLDLIGAEAPEFTEWLNGEPLLPDLKINRHGQLPHDRVLAAMRNADIYVYPTRHPGEGHNNSINEAMMNGLIILTTRNGFLGEVLSGECAYFLDAITGHNIAENLHQITTNREKTAAIAGNARAKLLSEFTDSAAKKRFEDAYHSLLETSPKQGLPRMHFDPENSRFGSKTAPVVSIVTVVYNGETHLENTIQSVISQDYPNIEYVIVDGGSTDSTPDIIEAHKDHIDVLISEPDEGIYDAINKGIQSCSGDVIKIQNADDLLLPGAVTTAMDALSQHDLNKATILIGHSLVIDGQGRTVGRITDKPVMWKFDSFNHPGWFATAQTYRQFGPYSQNYQVSSDYEYYLRFKSGGGRILWIKDAVACYRQDGTSAGFTGAREVAHINRQYLGWMAAGIIYVQHAGGKLIKPLARPAKHLVKRVNAR